RHDPFRRGQLRPGRGDRDDGAAHERREALQAGVEVIDPIQASNGLTDRYSRMVSPIALTANHYILNHLRGGIAKWLRRRSAKPLFPGSNPGAASKLTL